MSRESALAIASPGTLPVSPALSGGAPSQAVEAPPPLPSSTAAGDTEVKSKAFSILAKKEADIVRQREALKLAQDEVTPILKKAREFEELRKTDPVAAMKMIGFSETEIFNYMANQAPVELTPEEKAVKAAEDAASAKIKAFEDAQAQKEADAQKKNDEAVIQSYRNNISGALKASPDKFEYCVHYGAMAEDLIYETVKAVVESSQGKDVPTPEEAAQMVEEFYEEQDKAMSKLKKRQPPAPEVPTPPAPTAKPATRTLSSGTTVTAASARNMHETFAQKRERLIEKLRNGG